MLTAPRVTQSRRSGLASYTFQVGLGPARAFSSYARRMFHARYQDKHQYPRIVFLFDAALVGVCALLVALLVSVMLRPSRPPSLTLNLTAPPLTSGVPVPLIARIGTTKDAHNVRLQWRLPPGTEILSSEPVVSADGRVFLGDVTPGQTLLAHLVVRLFQPVGATASFGFKLTSEEDGRAIDSIGSEDRPVVGSALTARVPDAFQIDTVPSEGGVLPLVVENRSEVELPYVQVTFDPPHPSLGERVTLGDLAANEQRFIFVPLIPNERDVRVSWIVSSAAREVSRGTWKAAVADWKPPEVAGPLVSRPGAETRLRITGANAQHSLLVVHPLLDQPVREIRRDGGLGDVVLPAFTEQQTPAHEWFVAFVFQHPEGRRMLGPAIKGIIKTSIPFETSVRYTSSEGDQIGAGPNPPVVGQDTRYWVFWIVGPISDAVSDVRVSTTLPPRVRATGNVTAPNGGTWIASGRSVSWTLSKLGVTEPAEAVFGYEVEVTPEAGDAGRLMTVVATSTASASDIETETVFRMQSNPVSIEVQVLP